MNAMLKDTKTTIAVDGMPKCDVYTASAAIIRAREEQAAHPDAKITMYQWDNLMYAYNPYTDNVDFEY